MSDLVAASALVEAARSLVGVPYKHQGRNEHGIDCLGLVILACRRAGLDLLKMSGLKDSRNYGRGVNPRAVDLLRLHCADQVLTPVPGCLVVFRFFNEPGPRHQGIMTDADSFVHANGEKKIRQVVETGLRGVWGQRAHSFWLLPGVRYGA